MPCNSDYLEATQFEKEMVRAHKLLIWVYKKLGHKIPGVLRRAARDYYGEGFDSVPVLCGVLKGMTVEDRDRLIYGNARDRVARDLANWWEDHQKADCARLRREMRRKYGR